MTTPTRSAEDTKRVCAALHDLNLSSKRGLADEVIQVLLVLQLREQGFDVGFERRELLVAATQNKPNIRGTVAVMMVEGQPIARKGREGWECVREDVCKDLWKTHRRSVKASEIQLSEINAQKEVHMKHILEVEWLADSHPEIKSEIEHIKGLIASTIQADVLSATQVPATIRSAPRL